MASMAKAGRRNPVNPWDSYVQIVQTTEEGTFHKVANEAGEFQDLTPHEEAELIQLINAPPGEWRLMTELDGSGSGWFWRVVPDHLVELLESHELIADTKDLETINRAMSLPEGTRVYVTGQQDIDHGVSLELENEPGTVVPFPGVRESWQPAIGYKIQLDRKFPQLDEWNNSVHYDIGDHLNDPGFLEMLWQVETTPTPTTTYPDTYPRGEVSGPPVTPHEAHFIIDALRAIEHDPSTDERERLTARKIKGKFTTFLQASGRRRNPVVTNRVGPNSPVMNAGVLAAPLPGGYAGYNYPKVNAGALAVAMPAPSSLNYPGVVNGSHGLLGPRIRRSVPRQPLRRNNPHGKRHPTKKDLQWGRNKDTDPAGYELHGPNTTAIAFPYKPRSTRDGREFAEFYANLHGQKVPTGTKWALLTSDGRDARHEGLTAHKTLASAKRKGLQLIKNDWDNI